jgi:hypothetical protein
VTYTISDDDLPILIRAVMDDPALAVDLLHRLDVATQRQRRDIARAERRFARQVRLDARLRRIASRNTNH